MKKKALEISVFIPAVFLAVFVLSGCSKKTEIKSNVIENEQQQDSQSVEGLSEINEEQQTQIDELKEQQEASQEQQQSEEGQKNVQGNNSSTNTVAPKNCSADVVKYCSSESFTDEKEFKKFLKVYENNFSTSEYQKYKKQFTTQFNKCQEALRCD
jgi:hypothetical protein